jgi:hypothetical protein
MSESKEVTTIGSRASVLSHDQVVSNRDLVRKVMASVMVKGLHYGTIPGTGDKPTLLKPGAEVLLSTFRIATTISVENLGDDDVVRYRVVVKGMHSPSGIELGEGIGECSSDEAKYKWRRPVCQQEFDDYPRDRKRMKWFAPSGKEPQAFPQVRTEPSDVANTILKMAKKRAMVDFTLTALAVSDLFAQDAEELDAELRGVLDEGGGDAGNGQQTNAGAKPATNKPQATTAAKDAKAGNGSERKGSAGAQAAKAAASGAGATVPVVDWRKRLDVMGFPENDFAKRFALGSLDDVALKDVAKVEQELVDIERRQPT